MNQAIEPKLVRLEKGRVYYYRKAPVTVLDGPDTYGRVSVKEGVSKNYPKGRLYTVKHSSLTEEP